MNEIYRDKPEWNRFDTIKSIRDLGELALDTVAQLLPMNLELKDLDTPEQE